MIFLFFNRDWGAIINNWIYNPGANEENNLQLGWRQILVTSSILYHSLAFMLTAIHTFWFWYFHNFSLIVLRRKPLFLWFLIDLFFFLCQTLGFFMWNEAKKVLLYPTAWCTLSNKFKYNFWLIVQKLVDAMQTGNFTLKIKK